jgi:hypothetical protein
VYSEFSEEATIEKPERMKVLLDWQRNADNVQPTEQEMEMNVLGNVLMLSKQR